LQTSYSTKDKEFINKRWGDTLNRFKEDFDKWENHSKIDYVRQLVEITDLKIQSGLLDIETSDIGNYLIVQLSDYDVSERTIYRACSSEQKGKYFKSDNMSQLGESDWQQVAKSDTELLEKDQFNNYKVNGELVTKVKFQRPEPSDTPQPTQVKLNDTTKSIFALEQCGSLLERMANYMRINYIENKEILDKAFKDKNLFYLDCYAVLTNARKEIDERNKWGDYEKIMSKFLIDTGESTARIAELLNYSSKYGSIGIDRHGEFVDPQTKEFKRQMLEFLMKCPSCNDNIYHIINENIEKYRKGKELEIKLPL